MCRTATSRTPRSAIPKASRTPRCTDWPRCTTSCPRGAPSCPLIILRRGGNDGYSSERSHPLGVSSAADALWTDERGGGGAQRGSFWSEEGREHLRGGGHARRSRADGRRRTRAAEPSRRQAADTRGGAEQSALHNYEAAQTCTISPVRGLPVTAERG